MSVFGFYLWNVLKVLINWFFCNISTGFSWHLRETRNNFKNLINKHQRQLGKQMHVNFEFVELSVLFKCNRLFEIVFGSCSKNLEILLVFRKIHNTFELCTSPNWTNGQFGIWNWKNCFKRSIFRHSCNFWWFSGLLRHILSEPNYRFDLYWSSMFAFAIVCLLNSRRKSIFYVVSAHKICFDWMSCAFLLQTPIPKLSIFQVNQSELWQLSN